VRSFKGIFCDDISEIAVGTLITERPPHRTVRAQFGHTACMGLSLSRVHHAIFVVLCCFILCSTRAASIVPSGPHITVARSRTVTVKDGDCSAPPKACPAPMRARRQAARDRVVYHAMIRGEPAIGHEQSRANHACIRLNPCRVPTMKQSYASAGKAPRRRVHSPSGIAAIAVYGLPPPRIVIGYRALSAVRAEPCLSFLVLQYCSRRRPQLDTVRYLTGRGQAPQRYQQLARQCHDHCRLARAARPLGPRAIPPRQRAVFLEH
jgi:hypothetical protein